MLCKTDMYNRTRLQIREKVNGKEAWKKRLGLKRIRFPHNTKGRVTEYNNMDQRTPNSQLLFGVSDAYWPTGVKLRKYLTAYTQYIVSWGGVRADCGVLDN